MRSRPLPPLPSTKPFRLDDVRPDGADGGKGQSTGRDNNDSFSAKFYREDRIQPADASPWKPADFYPSRLQPYIRPAEAPPIQPAEVPSSRARAFDNPASIQPADASSSKPWNAADFYNSRLRQSLRPAEAQSLRPAEVLPLPSRSRAFYNPAYFPSDEASSLKLPVDSRGNPEKVVRIAEQRTRISEYDRKIDDLGRDISSTQTLIDRIKDIRSRAYENKVQVIASLEDKSVRLRLQATFDEKSGRSIKVVKEQLDAVTEEISLQVHERDLNDARLNPHIPELTQPRIRRDGLMRDLSVAQAARSRAIQELLGLERN